MTDDEEEFEKLKAALIKTIGSDIEPDRATNAIIAACMLSEGMGMTFEVFNDPGEALQAIFSCVEKVGKHHGIDFRYENGFESETRH